MSKYSSCLFTAVIIILTLFMLMNPRETIAAASFGFHLWYATVFPALFPFFIAAELLVSLRFVNLLGLLLEPVMRPLFKLPGCSSLVLVMGFTSGFPVGAILTRNLYNKQMLTADEAERLVSFTNNSSPLFIVGAVGVGMFGSPALGYLLAAAHYISNLLLGFFWRFKPQSPDLDYIAPPTRFKANYPGTNGTDSEPDNIGKILGSSINNALNNILSVGGFIIVFSVLTRMLSYWGCIDLMAAGMVKLLSIFNIDYRLAYGLSMGFFEITIGSQTVAAAESPELLPALLAVSSILAFSGLSIIAQVMSIMAGMPVRLSFYLLNRCLQIILSLAITAVVYHFLPVDSISAVSLSTVPPIYKALYCCNMWTLSLYGIAAGLICIMLLLGAALKKN